MDPNLLKTRNKRNSTKIVTDQTYIQFRLTNIASCTWPSNAAARFGKMAEIKLTENINTKLGMTIPFLKVLCMNKCFKASIMQWVVLHKCTFIGRISVSGAATPQASRPFLWPTKQELACCIEKTSKNVKVHIPRSPIN